MSAATAIGIDRCHELSRQAGSNSPAVAQVIGAFGGGGAQRVAYNLGLGLRSLGVECIGIAVRRAGDYAEDRSLPVVSLDAGDRGVWKMLRAMWRLRRLIRLRRIDLIHMHGSTSLPLCALAMLGMRRRPRMWFTWHDSGLVVGRGWRWRLMGWALNQCERVFGDSRQIVEKLQVLPGLAGRLEVFPNGVPEMPERLPDDGREPVILWMARFVSGKNPQILIRAAAKLRDEGLRFRVVMAGMSYPSGYPFFDECKGLVKQLGLEQIISFPGWVEETTSLIRSAAIGVQTSHSEGLSLTLLEQMMSGLAVVATDVGDTATAVEHEKTGLLIPPGDESSLHAALKRLLMDRELRSQFGVAARSKALAAFSVQAMARRVVAGCFPSAGAGQWSVSMACGPECSV